MFPFQNLMKSATEINDLLLILDYDPRICVDDLLKAAIIVFETLLQIQSVQICGVTLIIDLNDLTITHLKYFSFYLAKRIAMCFQASTVHD